MQEGFKVEYFLWQLFHIEKDIRKAKSEMRGQEGDLRAAAESLRATEAEIEEKRKAQAGFNKQKLLLEKKMKKRKGDADKQVGLSLVHSVWFGASALHLGPLQPGWQLL